VVIGSRLIQILETETRDNVAAAARAFMAGIRAALDA
jgi:tryptophan synthase alpha chain